MSIKLGMTAGAFGAGISVDIEAIQEAEETRLRFGLDGRGLGETTRSCRLPGSAPIPRKSNSAPASCRWGHERPRCVRCRQ